jgi:hypothetical protein
MPRFGLFCGGTTVGASDTKGGPLSQWPHYNGPTQRHRCDGNRRSSKDSGRAIVPMAALQRPDTTAPLWRQQAFRQGFREGHCPNGRVATARHNGTAVAATGVPARIQGGTLSQWPHYNGPTQRHRCGGNRRSGKDSGRDIVPMAALQRPDTTAPLWRQQAFRQGFR